MTRSFFWTAAALGSRALGQVLLTLAVVTRLPHEAAALWFLFTSVGALVQLLDMGLSAAVLRSASHLWAGVTSLRAQGMATVKNEPNLPGMRQLKATMGTVYALLGLAIVVGGWAFAHAGFGPLLHRPSDELAWGFFCLAAALQLMVSERYNYLQGVGRLVGAQQIFCVGVILSFGVTALFIALSQSLLLACVFMALSWLVQYLLFSWAARSFDGGRFSWQILRDVWPNAWRTGLSRASLAMIYYLPAVIVARVAGVVAGGQYGFTVQLCHFICALAQAPMTAVTPQLHEMAARKELPQLKRLFFGKLRRVLALYALFAVGLVAMGPALLQLIGARTTLLPGGLLAVVALFFFFELHRNNFVLLVSAFNRFPFWKYDLISGAAITGGSTAALSVASVAGLTAWLWLVQASWNFWWPVRLGLQLLGVQPRRYGREFFGKV